MVEINWSLKFMGFHGNLGSRTRFEWKGKVYYLMENQIINETWEAWRIVLCDEQGFPLLALPIKTPKGDSYCFANPNLTILHDNRMIISFFMPTEGNNKSEVGNLIYII